MIQKVQPSYPFEDSDLEVLERNFKKYIVIFISNHKFSWLHWKTSYIRNMQQNSENFMKGMILYWFNLFFTHCASCRYFIFCMSLTSMQLFICAECQENLGYLKAQLHSKRIFSKTLEGKLMQRLFWGGI